MQTLTVNNANIRIIEPTYLFDTGALSDVEIVVEDGAILHYCLIAESDAALRRHVMLKTSTTFHGTAIFLGGHKSLDMISEVLGDMVSSHIELLALATHTADIALCGVARVTEPYRHISTRVDQTNILIGNGARVRGIPKLEIATDDVEGGHSCKIHRLGGEALFYLQSRGLDTVHSEALLLHSEILRHLSTLEPTKKEERCHALHKILETLR